MHDQVDADVTFAPRKELACLRGLTRVNLGTNTHTSGCSIIFFLILRNQNQENIIVENIITDRSWKMPFTGLSSRWGQIANTRDYLFAWKSFRGCVKGNKYKILQSLCKNGGNVLRNKLRSWKRRPVIFEEDKRGLWQTRDRPIDQQMGAIAHA